jgi:DNA-binding transcriptional regulator of glucitol operon
MKTPYEIIRFFLVIILAAFVIGCAEAKIGIGPFKAASVEIGPGGFEAKGPSAGPFKTKSVEAKMNREDDE